MRKLEEIIKEIKALDNDLINTNIDTSGFYRDFKNGELKNTDHEITTQEYWDEEAEEQKQRAINFITKKYEELKKCNAKDISYELADLKTFEEYFNIIKDEEEKKRLDEYMNNQTENFFNRLSNTLNAD